jgi:hypothetical protein
MDWQAVRKRPPSVAASRTPTPSPSRSADDAAYTPEHEAVSIIMAAVLSASVQRPGARA